MLESEIRKGELDARGETVTDVFIRRSGVYAIYATGEDLVVHYGNNEEISAAQLAGRIRGISDLRAEMTTLIRHSSDRRMYQRRIADALSFALDGDMVTAVTRLQYIKAGVLEDLAATQRFRYMLWVSIWFVSYLILLFLLSEYVYPFEQQGDNLWLAGKGALVGSLFSVGIAYRSRQIALGTDARDNATDGLVRLGIGVIAGCVALLLLTSGFAPNLVIGSTTLTAGTINWHAVLMIGFVAGFLERLVPNMLDKAGTDLSPPSSKDVSQSARFTQRLIPDDAPDIPALKSPPAVLLPIVPTGGPDPKPTPDPAVRGTTSAVDRLREIREDLHTTRRMIGALNGLVSNSELAFSANALTGSLDQMLETIDVALGVGASAPAVADLADAVSQLLRQLGNVGLPCVLGVVMSVLEGSMKVPGGGAWMTAGLMVSGLQALSNERKFDAWMTALLVQPFSRTLLPTTVDESFASSALELSPLTSKHLQGASPNVATELLRASVMLAEDGNLRSCVDLAQELLSDADPIGLRRCFASEVELSEALEEYRASVIFLYARSELSGVIAIPAFAGGPVYVQDMDLLLTRVFMLRKDSRAGEALQKIVRLVQLLSGLHLDPGKLATMVFSGLHTGAEMVTRTVCLSSLLQRAPHADPTTNFTAAGARTASEKQMEASSPSWSS